MTEHTPQSKTVTELIQRLRHGTAWMGDLEWAADLLEKYDAALREIGSGYYMSKDAPKRLDECVDLAREALPVMETKGTHSASPSILTAEERGILQDLIDGPIEDAQQRVPWLVALAKVALATAKP